MRRFFLGARSKDKDKEKEEDKDRQKQDVIATNARKSVSSDVHKPVPSPPHPHSHTLTAASTGQQRLDNNNATPSTDTAIEPSPHSKQVAFANQALQSGNVSPPAPQQASISSPTQGIAHEHDAHEREHDATLRANGNNNANNSARRELPSFNGTGSNPSPTTQFAQRSGTSLSHNTTASTASSSPGGSGHGHGHGNEARRSFYGLGGGGGGGTSSNGHGISGSADKAYYPNLAILATYARDMAAFSSGAAGGYHNGGGGGGLGIMQHLTWSEITDEELVENLGGRERTRQEVLFEMVCSEERYVQELLTLKENYLEPLLERHCMPPSTSPSPPVPSKDAFSSATLRSIASSGTTGSQSMLGGNWTEFGTSDPATTTTTTTKASASFDARRPFLSLSSSVGASSVVGSGYGASSTRYGSLALSLSNAERTAGTPSRQEQTPSSNVTAAAAAPPLDSLPIAARFARRVSVDSHPIAAVHRNHHENQSQRAHQQQEFGVLTPQTQMAPSAHVNAGSTGTTRTAFSSSDEHARNRDTHNLSGRRDVSGGSGGTGTTAVDSGEETDNGSASNHGHHNQHQHQHQHTHHARFAGSTTVIGSATTTAATSGSKSARSRLAPLFTSNRSNAALAESKDAVAQERDLNNLVPTSSNAHVQANASTTSVNIPRAFRHHLKSLIPPPPNKLHKISSPNLKDPQNSSSSSSSMYGGLAGPAWVVKELPQDLRVVCEVVMKEILDGHQGLSERLRSRYEEQFPLVRTLADVFHDQAWMIEHYATYVLHLERALGDIDDTLSLMKPLSASTKKVKNRDKDALKEQTKLAKIIMRLEEEAAMKGAPGLSICISQPFQRLLKYPLLFQSLLYHTDPSTRDYDATQKLAFEIDAIVRSIENEKASEEDRAKTRDVWARIEGITDRALLVPRADRLLVSEEAMWSPSATPGSAVAAARRTFSDAARRVEDVQAEIAAAATKKKATKRLSDITGLGGGDRDKRKKQPNIGSKRDVWLVSFTDVVIRCQRVAVTKLPMQSPADPLSFPNRMQNGKENVSGRRTILLTTRERNLYRFLKVDHWVMEDKTRSGRAGMVSMDDVARTRRSSTRLEERTAIESEEEDEEDYQPAGLGIQQVNFGDNAHGGSKMSSADSRMSFTYSGDEPRSNLVFDVDPLVGLRPEKPFPSPEKRTGVAKKALRTSVAVSASTQQAMRKQGTAAAKFSNRLRPSLGDTTNLHTVAKRAASPPNARSATSASHRDISSAPDRGGFNKPTAASLARQTAVSPPTSAFLSPGGRTGRLGANPSDSRRIRAASSSMGPEHDALRKANSPPTSPAMSPSSPTVVRRNSLPSSQQGASKQLRTKHSSERLGLHGKHGSDMASGAVLYNQYWSDAPAPARA